MKIYRASTYVFEDANRYTQCDTRVRRVLERTVKGAPTSVKRHYLRQWPRRGSRLAQRRVEGLLRSEVSMCMPMVNIDDRITYMLVLALM